MTNASAWFALAGALSGLPRSGILWVPVIVPHILSRFPLNESEVRNVAFSCASIKLGN